MIFYIYSFISLLLLVSSRNIFSNWLNNQNVDYRPLERLSEDQLRRIILLSDELDPEGEVFDGILRLFMRPRYVGTVAHEEVRKGIRDWMLGLQWHVHANETVELATPVGMKNFTNVIATHDVSARSLLVLACHYETIYMRERFHGAIDSAVPCSMIMYLAYLITPYLNGLKQKQKRTDLTPQLIFFDGEEAFVRWTDEDSLYGSRYLATKLSQTPSTFYSAARGRNLMQIERISLFILLDLLGAGQPTVTNTIAASDREFSELSALETRLRHAALVNISHVPHSVFRARYSAPQLFRPQVEDDHVPFMKNGVKVLHLITSPFPSVWHKDSDSYDNVDWPTVNYLNTLLRAYVISSLHTPALYI